MSRGACNRCRKWRRMSIFNPMVCTLCFIDMKKRYRKPNPQGGRPK